MKARTISRKLVSFMIFSLLVTFIATSLMVCIFIFSASRQNSRNLAENQISLISVNVGNKIDEIEQSCLGLMFNSTIQNVLENPDVIKSFDDRNVITYVLSDYRNFTDPGNITLFDLDGHVITSSEGYSPYAELLSSEIAPYVLQSKGDPVWIPTHVDTNDFRTGGNTVISITQLVRKLDLKNVGDSGEPIGYILINVETSLFYDIISPYWNDSGRLSLFMQGVQVAVFDNLESRSVLDLDYSFRNDEWSLYGELPSSVVYYQKAWITVGFITEMFFIIVIAFLAARFSRKISSPLVSLKEIMKKENFSHETYSFTNTGIIEIDSIQRNYLAMIRRLGEMNETITRNKIRETELEVENVKAQLTTLQHQINPHFLYNTLDSIHWMAEFDGNDEIVEMIERLSDFLRFHTRIKDSVLLSDEIRNCENYIYIQKIRFGDMFTYDFSIPKELMSAKIVQLTIQPIIENSIIHAGATEKRPVHIGIKAEEKGDDIVLTVEDDGTGMTEEKLEELRSSLYSPERVGLSNVAKRLRLYYGDKASIEIFSRPDEGTCIVLTFPKRYE